jgi:hypothetical protein
VRRLLINSVLLGAVLAFCFTSASAQQSAPETSAPAATPQLDVPANSAAAQPVTVSAAAVPLSQPGARGQLHAAVVPPVPVPPGPVAPTEIKPAPPTPIAVKKVELQGDDPWNPEWDVLIEENLPPELLSRDVDRAVKPFCPRFNSLPEADKRAFWAYFFQALAGAEAGLRPTADVRHTQPAVAIVDPVTHHISRQEGLLQLKYQDSDRYGCDFDWEHDRNLPVHDPDKTILNPGNNLLCGINILRNQLIDLHEPLLTRKSYWATLRPGSAGYRNFVRQMANVPEACGRRTSRPRPRLDQRIDRALTEAFVRHQSADSSASATQASSSFDSQP